MLKVLGGVRPMITAIVQYRLPSSIDLKACAEHSRKIAPGFRRVPGLIRKQFILCRGRLGRWRLSVEDARRRRGVLFGAVARRHPRALRHGPADQVFPHRLRDRQLGRRGAAPRPGVAHSFGSVPGSNWLPLTPGCAIMSLFPTDGLRGGSLPWLPGTELEPASL
jgi:hypothetical protein